MALDKRKLLGPLFQPLSRARHSPAARYIEASFALPGQVLRARHNRPWFVVDISSAKGLGALLAEAVLMCAYAERNGLRPHIVSSNPLYADEPGRDFLAQYVGPRDAGSPPPADLRPMRYRTLQSFYHLDFGHHLPLHEAHRLFMRHLVPRPVITERAQAMLARVDGGRYDLSVHCRSTDKALEAPLVPYEAFARAIEAQVAVRPVRQVFLATDDSRFAAWIRQRFPQLQFHDYNLGGDDIDVSRGRHFSALLPRDKAIEALVNMVLLAAAPVCIRSASYLSAISRFINPELQTMTLNRDHWGSQAYPEFEIVAEEAARDARAASAGVSA